MTCLRSECWEVTDPVSFALPRYWRLTGLTCQRPQPAQLCYMHTLWGSYRVKDLRETDATSASKGDPKGYIRVSTVMMFQSRQQNSDTETIWPSLYRDPERPADHVASEWQAQRCSPGFPTSCKICSLHVLFPTTYPLY